MTILALHPAGGVAPGPGVRVLKAADHLVLAQAEALLAEARREADEVRARAEIAYEERRKEGFAAGREEGKAGMTEQLINMVVASVNQVAAMEQSVVDLVMQSLRTVLGSFDDAELVERVVAHALLQVRDEQCVLIRVAASDVDAVKARLDDFSARYPGIGRLDVSADSGLAPGSCVLETASGVVDASLDRQLAIMDETFRRHLEGRGSGVRP